MSEPVQACTLCGRQVTVTHDGRGFPPLIAERRLRKLCAAAGCDCDPQYTAGISMNLAERLRRGQQR